MPLSSPQDFKDAAAKRRKTKDIEVEGVGAIRLRALSASEAITFQHEVKKVNAAGGNTDDLSFGLIAQSWISEDGSPFMPQEEGEAVARSLAPDVFAVIAKAVLVLNGMDEKAVEEAEKN